MIRPKCLRVGHKFRGIEGVSLPYVFCARWGCDASAVSAYAPSEVAVSLHNAIPIDKRFPPVELDANGQAKNDPRECGWMGCGHPRCEPVCAAVPVDEWRRWKEGS